MTEIRLRKNEVLRWGLRAFVHMQSYWKLRYDRLLIILFHYLFLILWVFGDCLNRSVFKYKVLYILQLNRLRQFGTTRYVAEIG